MATVSIFGQLSPEAESIKLLGPEIFEKIQFKAVIDSDNDFTETTKIINEQCNAIGRIGELSEDIPEDVLFVIMERNTAEIKNEYYTDFVKVAKELENYIDKKVI